MREVELSDRSVFCRFKRGYELLIARLEGQPPASHYGTMFQEEKQRQLADLVIPHAIPPTPRDLKIMADNRYPIFDRIFPSSIEAVHS